jgi:uncharacterized protein (TIGR04562 family)
MSKNKLYLPVIESPEELRIPWEALRVIIGGKSVIDTSEIKIKGADDAISFLKAYGLNPESEEDAPSLRLIIDLSTQYLEQVILPTSPELIFPTDLKNYSAIDLLVAAASANNELEINWPCILLKVCHATAHALWEHDIEAHEKAIYLLEARLKPYLYESHGTWWIGDSKCQIPLVNHQIKREKHLFRVITKLLHKPGNISSAIRDQVGIRFVVEDIFCAVFLITFLKRRNIFMYANNIPEEARNSLVGLEEIEQLYKAYGPPSYCSKSGDSDKAESNQPTNNATENPFSSSEFGMIKMVQRLLVTLPSGRRTFFPYELQVLTRSKWENLSIGDAHHDAYEKRQVEAVKRRLFVT